MKRILIAAFVASATLLSACNSDGPSADEQATTAEASAAASASAAAKAREAADAEQAAAQLAADKRTYQRCASKVRPLIGSLNEVDSRLSIGLNIGEYETALVMHRSTTTRS